jgi:putative phosphoribosyl transferase
MTLSTGRRHDSLGRVLSRKAIRDIGIPAGHHTLAGILDVPSKPIGVIVFAHGSGSSRLSPRNQAVAADLRGAGFGTLLLDLLTEEEDREDARTAALRFDIPLLAGRVVAAVDFVAGDERLDDLPVGCFGASTGAAAAIVAGAARPERVGAVVSRGGRPDLAGDALGAIRAPTLLIVGRRDPEVLELNEQALSRIGAESRLEVVPGATHLFEEPGALEEVSLLAVDWFGRHLSSRGSA